MFVLFHQLINVDKSWNPATLGMSFSEIIDEVTVHRRLGMTFGETPWSPRLRTEIWQANQMLGVRQPSPPPLTSVWMPGEPQPGKKELLAPGSWAFHSQAIPYPAMLIPTMPCAVAFFVTHPVHQARWQVCTFRHLPPDPQRFAEIYPELLHSDDRWVKFYNEVMDSGLPVVSDAPGPEEPSAAQYASLRSKVDLWLAKEGMDYLQQVIYQKMTPEEGARRFFHDLKAME